MTEQILGFCMALGAGCAGFLLFRLIRFPAAAVLGSMAATGALNVYGLIPHFNAAPVSFVCSVGIGLILGRQINRKVLGRVKSLLRPVLVQVGCMLLLSLACGYIFYLLAAGRGISLGTALVSSTAGGLTEMLVFGLSIGGDVGVIAFVQLFRIVTFLTLIPYSAKLARKLGDRRESVQNAAASNLADYSRRDYLLLVPMVFAGGYLGLRLHIPAGAMLGSMLFAGLLSVMLNKKYNNKSAVRALAQIGLGLVMGQRVDAEILSRLAALFLPVLGVSAVMLAGCVLLAFVQYKTTKYDLTTCLMCSAPAGMSQIALYAEETGTDVFTVSIFHTARLVSIVIIYPWLAMYFL